MTTSRENVVAALDAYVTDVTTPLNAQIAQLNGQIGDLRSIEVSDQAIIADLHAQIAILQEKLAAQTPTPTPTPIPTPTPTPTAPKALVGMSAPSGEWDARLKEVGPIEARRLFMSDFTDTSLSLVKSEATAGRVAVLSFKTGASSWADVAAGKRDADIKKAFATLVGFNTPVYVAVHHEPIANAGTLAGDKGTPADFVAMNQRVISLLPTGSKLKFGVVMNGYVWSSTVQGLTDAQIAQYLPKALLDKLSWLSADTYETNNETIVVRQKNMIDWTGRVGYKGRLGITEFGCLTAAHLTEACNYVQSTGRFDFLLCFNSNVNNRDNRSWQLTGDLLKAFQAAVKFATS